MNPLARDTITLYMQHTDSSKKVIWTRAVLVGVIFTQKTVRTFGSDGVLKMTRQTSITIPAEIAVTGLSFVDPKDYPTMSVVTAPAVSAVTSWTLKKGDVVVYGASTQEIGDSYTIAALKAASETYCTIQAVGDNTKRAMLNHWQIEAV